MTMETCLYFETETKPKCFFDFFRASILTKYFHEFIRYLFGAVRNTQRQHAAWDPFKIKIRWKWQRRSALPAIRIVDAHKSLFKYLEIPVVHDRNEEVQETREKVKEKYKLWLREPLEPDRNAAFGNNRNRVDKTRALLLEAFVRIERVLEEPRGISISRSRPREPGQQR